MSVRAIDPQLEGIAAEENDGSRGVNKARFFFAESTVLRLFRQAGWTRDDLLLYLLHCRGYSTRHRGSLMGEQAARLRIGLTKSPWAAAQRRLEASGLVLTVTDPGSKRPLTRIASSARLYGMKLRAGNPKDVPDGHRYEDHATEDLVKLPWSLIDQSIDGAPTIADLETVDEVLSLLSLYSLCGERGVVSTLFAWLQRDGDQYELGLRDGVDELFLVDRRTILDCGNSLLDSCLLRADAEGHGRMRGRWILQLWHSLEPRSSSPSDGCL